MLSPITPLFRCFKVKSYDDKRIENKHFIAECIVICKYQIEFFFKSMKDIKLREIPRSRYKF